MDARVGGTNRPQGERGREDARIGTDRRINRGARNMTLKGGAGEATGKFRNKTWKREDAVPEGDVERQGMASSTSPFGSSTFGASAFGQSAFQPPVSAFTTTPASSPPKRNAFGALIDSEFGQPLSTFGQPSQQTITLSQLPTSFASPSPFGTTASPASSLQPSNGLNAMAVEFKPGSAPAKANNPFGVVSSFSRVFPSSATAVTPGSPIPHSAVTQSAFGAVTQSAFSTSTSSFVTPPYTPTFSPSPPKSVFANSVFGPPAPSTPQINDAKRVFASQAPMISPMQASQLVAPISASSPPGAHISTPHFKLKQRSRWKMHDISSTTSKSISSYPKNPPPYRIPPNIQREIDQGNFASDNRFPGNRFLELKALRPSMRVHSIKHKLISDPEHRTDLTGAITVIGTCMDMCPEYERHEREFQKDVDDWEKVPGTNPKRIDHTRAVKKYRRSAAGNDEPLESDLRPPSVLKMTLNYLFYELLGKHGLETTYAFIRDRTRAIRTDFTIQHEKGPIAIECFERIARFHILALHRFCERDDVRGFDYWQEVEQMMKTLQSLMQFYDDNEGKFISPNEAEFRSYYILAHIRDTNSMRRLQALASNVFLDPVLQTAIEFHSYAQRNTHVERRTGHRAAKLKFRNSEACQNAFTRFFKRVKNEGTSYLMACLLEYHFGGVRKGAIHSLWKAYTARHRPLPTSDLMELLGMDDEPKTLEVAQRFGMALVDENGEIGGTAAVQLNKNSKFEYANQMSQRHSLTRVELKRGGLLDVEIVDGRFQKAIDTWRSSQSEAPVFTSFNSSPVEVSNQNTRRFSFVKAAVPPSAPAPIPFMPSLEVPEQNVPDVSDIMARPQIPNASQRTNAHVPIGFTSSVNFFSALTPASAPVSVPLTNVSAIAPSIPEPTPPTHIESVSTSPVWKLQEDIPPIPMRQPSQLSNAQESSILFPPLSVKTSSFPPSKLDASANDPLPAVPKALSPLVPTQEELLYEQKQAFLRASALARAKADHHLKFKILFTVFTHWKRKVMNRGHIRALREDQEARFRRSIRDMGLSTNSPTVDAKGKQKEMFTEEDLVPWEDTSQASSSTGMRRRPRKSMKRADDDATLAAIKEAEATRTKLWRRGTFLSSVAQCVQGKLLSPASPLPLGWQVWLSTTPDNTSTAEWLCVKFAADASTISAEIPGLNQITLSNSGGVPIGHSSTAGLIVFDMSTLMDEKAVRSDARRLLNLISLLPLNRHYKPSVILLRWVESADLPDQISSLLDHLQRDNAIYSWRALCFSNDGQYFDDQFMAEIQQLPLDTVGTLMETASIDDVYQLFFLPWDTALNEGIGICKPSPSDEFDWVLYGKVFAVMLTYINRLAMEVLRTCRVEASFKSFPPFIESAISDEQSAFEALIKYLNTGWMAPNHDASLLKAELSSDLFAGREFYVRAVPERLAHLTLHKIRESVPIDYNVFLDVKNSNSSVTSFTDAINASLAQLEHGLPSSPCKKRMASEEVKNSCSSQHSIASAAKRRKHDSPLTVVNGIPSQPTVLNGRLPKQDTLAHLRDTVARARRSIEDSHVRRDADRSLSPPDDDSDTWGTAHDFSQEQTSLKYPAQSGRKLDSMQPLFALQQNINFPPITPKASGVIPATPDSVLMSSTRTQSASLAPEKANHADPLLRFHPYLEGRGRSHLRTPTRTRVRGAASLTPRTPDFEGNGGTGGNLSKLKESLQCARRAIEESRRARQADEDVEM